MKATTYCAGETFFFNEAGRLMGISSRSDIRRGGNNYLYAVKLNIREHGMSSKVVLMSTTFLMELMHTVYSLREVPTSTQWKTICKGYT